MLHMHCSIKLRTSSVFGQKATTYQLINSGDLKPHLTSGVGGYLEVGE